MLRRFGYEVRDGSLTPLLPCVSPTRIARYLVSDCAVAVHGRTIAVGSANLGIDCYTAAEHVEAKQSNVMIVSPRRRFVAKKTSIWQEANMALKLHERRPRDALFPEVYAVGRFREETSAAADGAEPTYVIYMEHLPSAGTKWTPDSKLIDSLVATISTLNQSFPDIEPDATVSKLMHDRGRLISTTLSGETDLCVPDHEFADISLRASEVLSDLPVVISHNDVLWANLALVQGKAKPTWRLLDFGSIGRNIAGAEFHHFLRYALLDPHYEPFFEQLTVRYAACTGLDAGHIQLSANHYALFRCALRLRWDRSKAGWEGHGRHRVMFRQLHERLSSRLRQLTG
jgi:hypothetical protein